MKDRFRHGARLGCTICLTLLLVGRLAACAHAQGDSRQVGPFHIYANFPLDSLDHVFLEIAALPPALQQTLGVPPPEERVLIYLFGSYGSYRTYLRHNLPEVPYRRALFVREANQSVVLAYLSSELAIDLRHECTHALLHATHRMMPIWLDEGLAEYFEVPANERPHDNPHLNWIRVNSWFYYVPNLEHLESKYNMAEMGEFSYQNSFAWVHFMLHGPPAAREELIGYLADIRAGTPPGTMSSRLARRLPNVSGSFRQHFRTWRRPSTSSGMKLLPSWTLR